MRLYRVTTVVAEFDDCQDVSFEWFCHPQKRSGSRPYAELISNHDRNSEDVPYAEAALDELFDEAEAVALKAYLDREHTDGVTTIKAAEFPLPADIFPLSGAPRGGGVDHFALYREPAYNLPFRVSGYFDLRQCARKEAVLADAAFPF